MIFRTALCIAIVTLLSCKVSGQQQATSVILTGKESQGNADTGDEEYVDGETLVAHFTVTFDNLGNPQTFGELTIDWDRDGDPIAPQTTQPVVPANTELVQVVHPAWYASDECEWYYVWVEATMDAVGEGDYDTADWYLTSVE